MDEQTTFSYEYAPQAAPQPTPQPAAKKKGGIGRILCVCLLVAALAFGAGFAGVKIGFKTQSNVIIQQSSSAPAGDSVPGTPALLTGSLDTVSLAKSIVPTVVAITTEKMTTGSFWGGSYVTSGAGSGVIISEDGYILTSGHVITGATSITVELQNGQKYPAEVVGNYIIGDIAVIKIEATGLDAATLGKSDELQQGELVFAVGNPEGNFSGSMTDGIVSALGRTIQVSVETEDGGSDMGGLPYFGDIFDQLFGFGGLRFSSPSSNRTISLDVIQFSAAISPGNSGGGLFTADGKLIGIVCAKSSDTSAEGLSFAVPINTALEIGQALIATGSYEGGEETGEKAAATKAVLGISVSEMTAEQAKQYGLASAGLYVSEVNAKSTRDAGLMAGDRIVSIGDTIINTYVDLTTFLEAKEPGDNVSLIVDRNGKMVSLEITLQRNDAYGK